MTRITFAVAALALATSFGPALADSTAGRNQVVSAEQTARTVAPVVEGRQSAPVAEVSGTTAVEQAIIDRNLPKIGNGNN
ncbi:hypothetical protein EYW49_20410 [Siculibacillus lacustris]|uniref:DUF4148 domain-containing protein n=1 Tax=Siculibacillus lacustris TaxID=1549641 RepID=A0A4Q9VH26_9HYPH|nr:hypothetical protein [Siculibacillus lacustris]TBW33431.1 hypothetical protein EYW49_20410 [Siculibacillus lacustris]